MFMKKVLKGVLGIFAVFALFLTLASCFASYSSSSMKSGLEKAGYTVQENPVIVNLDTKSMTGFQSALYGYKTVNGEEDGILILIFDSTANADKAGSTEGSVATETMTIMHRWGKAHAPETDTSVYGVANNIVWAGSSAAKKAAGIF